MVARPCRQNVPSSVQIHALSKRVLKRHIHPAALRKRSAVSARANRKSDYFAHLGSLTTTRVPIHGATRLFRPSGSPALLRALCRSPLFVCLICLPTSFENLQAAFPLRIAVADVDLTRLIFVESVLHRVRDEFVDDETQADGLLGGNLLAVRDTGRRKDPVVQPQNRRNELSVN